MLELERATTAPEAGAGPESVTVPVDDPPPTTLDGLVETEEGGDWSTNVAVRARGAAGAVTLWLAAPPSDQETNS